MRLSPAQRWLVLLAVLAGGLILAWRAPQSIGDFLRSLPPLVQGDQ